MLASAYIASFSKHDSSKHKQLLSWYSLAIGPHKALKKTIVSYNWNFVNLHWSWLIKDTDILPIDGLILHHAEMMFSGQGIATQMWGIKCDIFHTFHMYENCQPAYNINDQGMALYMSVFTEKWYTNVLYAIDGPLMTFSYVNPYTWSGVLVYPVGFLLFLVSDVTADNMVLMRGNRCEYFVSHCQVYRCDMSFETATMFSILVLQWDKGYGPPMSMA